MSKSSNSEDDAAVVVIGPNSLSDKRVDEKRTNFSLFGPNLELMCLSRGTGVAMSSASRAEMNIAEYERYHKGYLRGVCDSDVKVQEPGLCNEEMKAG